MSGLSVLCGKLKMMMSGVSRKSWFCRLSWRLLNVVNVMMSIDVVSVSFCCMLCV